METEFCMVAPTERGRCQMPNVTIVRAVQCKTTMLRGLLESGMWNQSWVSSMAMTGTVPSAESVRL